MLLADRVVMVTGGGRGIGAAICRVLGKQGARVAINYSRSRNAAEAVAAEIREGGGAAETFQADVRDEAAVREMVEKVVGRWGGIHGAVNNAIAGPQHVMFGDASWEDYTNAFDFGCRQVVNVVRAVRPVMRDAGGGRIVNIVTELWNMAPGGWSTYVAGKGAMVGLSRTLVEELGPEGITVNMVAPGWMADEKVDLDGDDSRNFAAAIPLRRHGSADEIGNGCVFFLSDLAAYVSGAYLPVTGGRITQMGA